REPPRSPTPGKVLGPHPPVVRLHNRLHDRETQPNALLPRLRSCAGADERIEELEPAIFGDSGALVNDFYAEGALAQGNSNPDRRPRLRILARIRNQIDKDLADSPRV